jgi:integrase
MATKSRSSQAPADPNSDDSITLGEYLTSWLELCEGRGLRPASIASYHAMIRITIAPRLGHLQLKDITPNYLNGLYQRLLRDGRKDGRGGLSPRTVRYVHGILRKAFADAVRLGYVEANPCLAADPPSARAAKARQFPTWSPDDLRRFLDSVREDQHYAAFYLAVASGMRRGEVLGLRWCDLDLEAQQLSVVQCVIEVAHAVRVGPPKSERSRRMIALDAKTVAVLAEHKRAEKEKRLKRGGRLAPHELVFTHRDGSPIHPACFSQTFNRRVATAHVPRIRFHDLRHTHATLALRARVHPKIVSERLGHSTVAITLDIYSHCIPSLQREAAEAIGALLPQ